MSEPPTGYLRRYDDDLGGALALVIADTQTAGFSDEDADALVWKLAQEQTDFGRRREVGGEIALRVAERVQEHVMEDLRRIPWPECPLHPGTHPMWLALDAGPEASWACEESGLRVELGQLGGSPGVR